jgi:hypothetical protein
MVTKLHFATEWLSWNQEIRVGQVFLDSVRDAGFRGWYFLCVHAARFFIVLQLYILEYV